MQSQPCTRTLDVTTHGEYKSRHSAAIAVHFWDSTYADCETCELIPEVHKPFTRTMAGYWVGTEQGSASFDGRGSRTDFLSPLPLGNHSSSRPRPLDG